MSTSRLKLAAVVIGLGLSSILTAPFAQANPITPGQTGVLPDDLSSSVAGGTIVASTSGSFSVGIGGAVAGTYVTDVVRTLAGTLDFLIQVSNSGLDSLEHITDGNGPGTWSAFTTDVGISLLNPVGGTFTAGVPPTNINETPDGASISFNWISPLLLTGQTSALLVIATNATNWTAGNIGIIDSAAATVNGFIPTAVPGPIVGAGIPGLIAACGALLAFSRRRRQRLA